MADVFRRAKSADLDHVAEIYALGYACCGPWKPRPAYRRTVEDSVYVAPGAVGRGVGGRLLDELLAGCVHAGVRQVIAVVAATGEHAASLALHHNRGFTDAGLLTGVGFKHGRWLDTHLLQRGLRQGVASCA